MPRPDGSIYVGRLPKTTRARDLEDIFESYGRLLRCDIKYGTEMAYAFIDFEDRREAEDCVKYEHGRELNGQAITVEWAKGGKDKRLGYDECFRCRKMGHWARECPEINNWGRRGGGGGYGGGSFRRRSPSPRRRRSRSRERKQRSRSRSNDRKRRSKSRDRRRSRSQSDDRKRSRSGSRRSRSQSDDRKNDKRYKSGSRDRKSRSSGSKSRSPSKSRSRSKSPRRLPENKTVPENKTEDLANGDSSKDDRDTEGQKDYVENDDHRSRSASKD